MAQRWIPKSKYTGKPSTISILRNQPDSEDYEQPYWEVWDDPKVDEYSNPDSRFHDIDDTYGQI